jgi:hypothetical protein
MGMWASAPWDNDEAADWYGDLMDRTKLRERWLEGINEDTDDSPGVVRAAGALFVMLGRVYIWPIKTFDADLEIAIEALSKVARTEEYKESSELALLVETEIEELKTRRKQKDPSTALGQQVPAKPWWRFWS